MTKRRTNRFAVLHQICLISIWLETLGKTVLVPCRKAVHPFFMSLIHPTAYCVLSLFIEVSFFILNIKLLRKTIFSSEFFKL